LKNSSKQISTLTFIGYKRHFRRGFTASGGSLYLITTPLNVFVSPANLPLTSNDGFETSSAAPVCLKVIELVCSKRVEIMKSFRLLKRATFL
jgi:hypothetical protein